MERSRRLTVPTAIALVEIATSLAFFVTFKAAESTASAEHLADSGRELERVLQDLQAIALEQVLAIQAFYESSSTVTHEEFDHFVDIIGGPAENQLAYAHRVPSEGLDAFLALTRTNDPEFSVSGVGPQLGDDRWLLLYSSDVEDVGYLPGFDFGSDPAIRRALDLAFYNNAPVASSFVSIPGDADVGDIVIVSPISREGLPIGMGIATMTLDELLVERVTQLLGDGAQLTMTDDGAPVERSGPDAERWVRTVSVVGQEIRLTLDVPAQASSAGAAPWLLVLGIGTSILAGVLNYDRYRRRSMTQQVAALQKTLAEKDRFLASVSHELRTPLTAVVGMVEILAGRMERFDREDGELIQDVRSSAQELETLVEDHLTSARLTAGALTVKRSNVDLDLLVSRVIAITERPPRLTLKLEGLGTCTGDPIRVRQIVRNLVQNAYRHASATVEIRATNTTDLVIIEVINDGPPIPHDLIGTMFEPFVKGQMPGQPETIGLGLSVSRKLALRMGGDLTYSYDSSKVKFSLALPTANQVPKEPSLALAGPLTS